MIIMLKIPVRKEKDTLPEKMSCAMLGEQALAKDWLAKKEEIAWKKL